jgi:hypothetical protein
MDTVASMRAFVAAANRRPLSHSLAGLGRPDRNRSDAFIRAAVLLKLGDVVGTISTWPWNDVAGKFSMRAGRPD